MQCRRFRDTYGNGKPDQMHRGIALDGDSLEQQATPGQMPAAMLGEAIARPPAVPQLNRILTEAQHVPRALHSRRRQFPSASPPRHRLHCRQHCVVAASKFQPSASQQLPMPPAAANGTQRWNPARRSCADEKSPALPDDQLQIKPPGPQVPGEPLPPGPPEPVTSAPTYGEVLSIDLPTALRLTNANNPTIALARERVEEAYAAERQADVRLAAEFARRPELSAARRSRSDNARADHRGFQAKPVCQWRSRVVLEHGRYFVRSAGRTTIGRSTKRRRASDRRQCATFRRQRSISTCCKPMGRWRSTPTHWLAPR